MPVAAESFSGKSPHMPAEPSPSCSRISVGASCGRGPAMRYSSRKSPSSRNPWSESVAIAAYIAARGGNVIAPSDAEILVLHLGRRRQLSRSARPHHPAPLDQIMPVGDAGQRLDVLVDHQDRL